jgi:translation initiation factor 3 subunit C
MSRFFHGGGSDSDTSSSDEEELYSDHEAGEDEEHSESGSSSEEEDASGDDDSSSEEESKRKGANRFFKNFSESEESGDEDRQTVVKSAKDKRLEELEGTIKLIENAEKINDWAVISAGECYSSMTFFYVISSLTLFYRVR